MESLLDGYLGVEGESCVDFGGHFTRDDFQNLFAELDEQTIQCSVYFLVKILALQNRSVGILYIVTVGFPHMFFAILNCHIHKLGIIFLFRGSQYQRGIGGGILWLVFGDGCKVARIAYNGGAGGFELVQRVCHDALVTRIAFYFQRTSVLFKCSYV